MCSVLFCSVMQCSAVQCSAVFCCVVSHSVVWCRIVRSNTLYDGMIRTNILWHSQTPQYHTYARLPFTFGTCPLFTPAGLALPFTLTPSLPLFSLFCFSLLSLHSSLPLTLPVSYQLVLPSSLSHSLPIPRPEHAEGGHVRHPAAHRSAALSDEQGKHVRQGKRSQPEGDCNIVRFCAVSA